jgi:hypothetical protein
MLTKKGQDLYFEMMMDTIEHAFSLLEFESEQFKTLLGVDDSIEQAMIDTDPEYREIVQTALDSGRLVLHHMGELTQFLLRLRDMGADLSRPLIVDLYNEAMEKVFPAIKLLPVWRKQIEKFDEHHVKLFGYSPLNNTN